MDRTEKLKLVNDTIKNCRKCSLYRKRKHVVTGRGSPNPLIVFVGEAPGFEEDKIGKPFVGASGKLLEKWIDELGLDEKDYAILNVVKCIPLDKDGQIRRPTLEEIGICGEWLDIQLVLLEPKLIIALGHVASVYLTDKIDWRMDRLVNKLFKTEIRIEGDWYIFDVFCYYHPAFFLRSEKEYDLTKMKKVVLDKINEYKKVLIGED